MDIFIKYISKRNYSGNSSYRYIQLPEPLFLDLKDITLYQEFIEI